MPTAALSTFAPSICSRPTSALNPPMYDPLRYVRLWLAFAKFALLNELAFRANFLLKMFVEVLWLTILLMFYQTIFTKTPWIAGWNASEYRFFVGCYFALE